MLSIEYLSYGVILPPLIAAIITGLLNKSLKKQMTHTLCIFSVLLSFICSINLFYLFTVKDISPIDITLYRWGESGEIFFDIGFLLDRLTVVMISVVTFVSSMVHIYSIGYMQQDAGYQRFFSYISLFTFGMLILVMSNNFLQLFFGWEMVGFVSYLLIGFWFKKETAIFANLKAFLVNRFGDMSFIIGIAVIVYYFRTVHYSTIFSHIKMLAFQQNALVWIGTMPVSAITLICFLLFIGAMAKSAQIPLHVWLPDSMEGPTPISALIHAATMVTAGVFMVARLSPLFEHSETTLNFITTIGALTALLMGLVAIVQNDIKRIIAYSTLSQLGYMMVAMGVSAYSVGIFHLMTHAFFKALLFLGAGSVIVALHHEQNVWKMGNLKQYMPITYFTMLIGCLALIGFPFFSGFYSKELIIHATLHSKLLSAPFAHGVVLSGVLITAIYTFRLFFVVFHTQERFSNNDKTHPHEASFVIWLPLIILAIPSLISGALFLDAMLNDYFKSAILVLPQHNVLNDFRENYKNPIAFGLKGFIELPFFLDISGILITASAYLIFPNIASQIKNKFKFIYKILLAKFGFDWIYEKMIAPSVNELAKIFWIFGDKSLIDGLAVNGSAKSVNTFSKMIGRFQTGYLYHYTFVMIMGFLVMLLCVLWI